jgi:predicted AlkP superfamily phosphohydrolase/phosphomutase
VGIDGFSPAFMDQFLSEGKLPALGAVARAGVRIPLVSTLPACTPVAWATVATGAPPSITGVEGFLVHRPGERLDQRVSGCYSYRCRAQPLWEAAGLAGKSSYVVKFPLSYPSSTASFRLDGAAGWGGLKCLHEAASSSVGSTEPTPQETSIETRDGAWAGEDAAGGRPAWRGVWRLPSLWGSEPVALHVALSGSDPGEVVVHVADTPDRRRVLASLRQGEWSEPLVIPARGRRGVSDCCLRVKVLAASADPPSLRLLNTTLHERTGHSAPDEIWQDYVDLAGPIEEQSEPSLVFRAGLDLRSQLEIFALNARWLTDVSSHLLTREPWDLFMVQIHVVDWAHHLLHGAVDPRHPGYDAATAPRYGQALLDVYRMADDLVAAVASAVGPDANLIVLGDHGQDVYHTSFRTNEWLASQGLLRWDGGGDAVDWSLTRAYATGNYIYLNVSGRDPEGIVAPRDAARTRDAVVDGLLNLTDPSTGFRPVLIAGDKREFERLGADGPGVGDIVFCLRPGYQATNSRGDVFTGTVPLAEFTSGHDHFWPLDPSIHTRLFAAGPGFRRGYRQERTAHLTDVAPTVCALLGIDPPADCVGHPLEQALTRVTVPQVTSPA